MRKLLVAGLIGLLVASCGGGGGGSSSGSNSNTSSNTGSNTTSSITPITSGTQAKKAANDFIKNTNQLSKQASGATNNIDVVNNSRSMQTSGPKITLPKKAIATIFNTIPKLHNTTRAVEPISGVIFSQYGGNYTYSGSYDNSTNAFNLASEFNGYHYYDDDNYEYVDNGIIYARGYYKSDLDYGITITCNDYTDNALDGSNDNIFKNTSFSAKLSNNNAALIFNGPYTATWIDDNGTKDSETINLQNFKITGVFTDTGETDTINGKATLQYSQLKETYEYKTVKPIVEDYDENSDSGPITSGEVDINDNVKVIFNPNGTASVYYNNKLVETFDDTSLE